MKSLLVVGGDKLGNITEKLEQKGFREVIHLTGRKSRMVQINIPRKVDVILVLTDYVNHNLSNVIKKKAQEKSIPICYSKRSWCSINKEVQKTMTLVR
ncbi:hypothetical protein J2S09_004272 [Bacillus fengqiuensis]|nr:hypothetical protein [Bacillus fengqiuensis]